jgi:hypothetical protein
MILKQESRRDRNFAEHFIAIHLQTMNTTLRMM